MLRHGFHEKKKDLFDETHNTWNYAVRGKTLDKEEMRVIVSFDRESEMLIITAFYVGIKE